MRVLFKPFSIISVSNERKLWFSFVNTWVDSDASVVHDSRRLCMRVYQQTLTREGVRIGFLQDPITWYGINYAGTQITQWDFQNKGTLTSPARISAFVLKVPLRCLRPSIIYFVSGRIVQWASWSIQAEHKDFKDFTFLLTLALILLGTKIL